MVLNRVNNGRGVSNGKASSAGVNFRSKRIQASLSTQISIQIHAEDGQKYVVGGIQSLAYTQTRQIAKVAEVGTDGIVGMFPQSAALHTLSINRVVFDFQRLPQALMREYRHIHAQRRPFDIIVVDYNAYLGGEVSGNSPETEDPLFGGGQNVLDPAGFTTAAQVSSTNVIETTFQNCWFNNLGITYGQDNFQIIETATLDCQHVFDNQTVTTMAGPQDRLERQTNVSDKASVMSAFDATRTT
jgi:hypothetical protein